MRIPHARCAPIDRRRRASLGGQTGQGLVEYGLILVLVAVVAMVTLALIPGPVNSFFSQVAGALNP